MEHGVFMFGAVEMDDAGAGPPAPTDRRYTQKQMWSAAMRMLDMGVAAERLGFDVFHLTEHHFQYEGYEVIPNGILFGVVLAERTSRIKIGAMFHIVPQWHPLRFAEDFATLHNLSGGRAVLGVGRGTVPREAEALGAQVGSFDNPDKAEADRINRELMDEAMDVIVAALENETFSYRGKYFDFPPSNVPDRGAVVDHLTLVPRPLYPYDTWQPITSPPTLQHVPERGFGGVFWLLHHSYVKQRWEKYAEIYEQHHGSLAPGEKRNLVLNICVEDTHEEAWRSARTGHDEFWKFLGPYGWSKGYMGADGKPAAPGLIPTLEESVDQKVWIIGSPEEVAESIAAYKEALSLQHLTVFPHFPGDTYEKAELQMQRYAEEVRPLIE
ncbi:MAG TPA: LLM class flavin-dependent oxidoreductase [Ilumatobacteraceae bacterium]|nr:LLM class flavin-dependent oxidoreductase [Ilumatobacteraceae bacterium]